jgi:hypothetical protein
MLKIELLYDSVVSHLSIKPMNWKHVRVLTSINHNSQKVKKLQTQMSINGYEWITKMWDVDATNYHSALKRKEILTHGMTWMNLEDFELNEIS